MRERVVVVLFIIYSCLDFVGAARDTEAMIAAFVKKSAKSGSAALPPEGYTPIKLIHEPSHGNGLKSLFVEFCLVRYDYLKFENNIAPFHSNLVSASGCDTEGRKVKLSVANELIPAVAFPMMNTKSSAWNGLPTGVVLHVARCGSTAIANTFGSSPDAIALSEPEFINEAFDLRHFNVISRMELLLLLRVLTQLTSSGARELSQLGMAGGKHALFSENSKLLLKVSSNTPLFLLKENPLDLLAEAWPAAQWAFIIRDPVAVVSAQLSVTFSEFMTEGISPRIAAARAPCMRSRVFHAPYIEETLVNLTGTSSRELSESMGLMSMTMEAYCALHTASIYRGVLDFDNRLRQELANEDRYTTTTTKKKSVVKSQKISHSRNAGVLILEHGELPNGVMNRLMPHFGFDVASFTSEQLETISKVGRTYSKNGANTSDYAGKDSVAKREKATPAMRYWAETLALPLHNAAMQRRCELFGVCSNNVSLTKAVQEISTGEDSANNDISHIDVKSSQKFDFSFGQLLFSGGIVDVSVDKDTISYSDGESALSRGFPDTSPPATCPEEIVHGTGQYAQYEMYSDFSRLSLLAMNHFQSGSWLIADACWRHALTVESDRCYNQTTECIRTNRQNLLENLAALEDSISRATGARIWHGKTPKIEELQPQDPTPAAMHAAWSKIVKHSEANGEVESIEHSDGVEVYHNMLSPDLCEYIIELFDRSDELYSGNVLRNGYAEVDDSVKSTKEIDIGNSRFEIWHAVEWTLVQALTAAFARYEIRYSGYSFLPNPLHEDGFRVKKYEVASVKAGLPEYQGKSLKDIKGGSHNWHVDSSDYKNCRKIAVVFYLNDVAEGGETLFLTPRPRVVKPRQGSILLFPAGPSHYHAGARVLSEPKYGISNFLSVCDLDEVLGVPVRPPLNRTALTLARTYFKMPPHLWKRNDNEKKRKRNGGGRLEL